MEVINTEIEGVKIIKPQIYKDSRGYFFESFSEKEFQSNIGKIHFVQDNESFSIKGVLRGLHFQKPPYSQAKLVRCTEGKVLDIALDIRKGSSTFGKYVAVELTDSNNLQLFIPKGFAHGFIVLSDFAKFQYKCDGYYNPESEGGIYPLDKELNIKWLLSEDSIILSDKDNRHPVFRDFITPFI